jgi:hypothetical protein
VEIDPRHWYGKPQLKVGRVTAEGAQRLFSAYFRRVPLHAANSGVFRWSSTEILQWPENIAPYVKSITVSQPGADDEGQPYVPCFDR